MNFPAFDDFDMALVELVACGRPVIAFGRGGACDAVLDGETGVLMYEQTMEAFIGGAKRAEGNAISRYRLHSHARSFSCTKCIKRFKKETAIFIEAT